MSQVQELEVANVTGSKLEVAIVTDFRIRDSKCHRF